MHGPPGAGPLLRWWEDEYSPNIRGKGLGHRTCRDALEGECPPPPPFRVLVSSFPPAFDCPRLPANRFLTASTAPPPALLY